MDWACMGEDWMGHKEPPLMLSLLLPVDFGLLFSQTRSLETLSLRTATPHKA